MRSLHYYMLGTGTWFMGYGIQSVMFAWLVTMVLRESPEMVGLAQMTLLLPGMLLILVGGSYSDRYGGRRIAMAAQAVGALAPLLLLALLWFDRLSFSTMLVYAVLMGCAQAFVTPARDGLLNQVAAGRVQRTVMLTSMVQFGLQMFGFFVASLADTAGPLVILATQSLILTIGVFGFRRIPQVRISRPGKSRVAAIGDRRRTYRALLDIHADGRLAERSNGYVLHGVIHRHDAVARA